MLPILQVVVLLLFESFEGETDHLPYKLVTMTPQVSKRESPITNYKSREKTRSCSSDSDCPTWFICHNITSECCCGPRYNDAIICNKTTMILAVVECYCITDVNSITNDGDCFYNCGLRQTLKNASTKSSLTKGT